MDYFLLLLLWTCWCALHSLLISEGVVRKMEVRLGKNYRYYRLAFNIFAFLTLLPLIAYGRSLHSIPVFQWQGLPVVIQAISFLAAVCFFLAGAAKYDLDQFLGLAQIKSGKTNLVMTEDGRLDTSGILQVTRHPWYIGGILILWSYQQEIDLQSFLTNMVLSLYFIVGAFLEERKLLVKFGTEYRNYQKQVSMFLPFKWLRNRFH